MTQDGLLLYISFTILGLYENLRFSYDDSMFEDVFRLILFCGWFVAGAFLVWKRTSFIWSGCMDGVRARVFCPKMQRSVAVVSEIWIYTWHIGYWREISNWWRVDSTGEPEGLSLNLKGTSSVPQPYYIRLIVGGLLLLICRRRLQIRRAKRGLFQSALRQAVLVRWLGLLWNGGASDRWSEGWQMQWRACCVWTRTMST